MSLQKKANIIKVRKKLDLLDNKLLDLIKKRTILVKEILKNKSSKTQIVDKKRIRVVLRNVKKKSLRKNIESKLTQMIWKGMIKSYIDFEHRKFKKK